MAKVLVIEDQNNLLRLIRVNLTARGFEVHTAQDGEEGLKKARAALPDLVLLDLKMPKLSGWEVLEKMQAHRRLKKIPVIVITASPKRSEKEKARQLGAVDYMSKPFEINRLIDRIRVVLGKK